MTIEERTDEYKQIVRAEAARRILPAELLQYVSVPEGRIDWLMIATVAVEMSDVDQAAVAIVAHLLGMGEALTHVAPAPTFLELLELVDREARTFALGSATLLVANLEL